MNKYTVRRRRDFNFTSKWPLPWMVTHGNVCIFEARDFDTVLSFLRYIDRRKGWSTPLLLPPTPQIVLKREVAS